MTGAYADLITTPTNWEYRCMLTNARAGVPLTSRQRRLLEDYTPDMKEKVAKAISEGLEKKKRP